MMRKTTTRNLGVFVIALLVAAAGCVMVNELPIYKTRPIKFSHAVHLEKAELTCAECHAKAEDSDQAGMPGPATCKLCHDNEKDVKEKLQPFVVDGKLTFTNVTKLPEDVTFSHQNHLAKGVKCEDCHQGIRKSEAVSEKLHVSKDDCFSCHTQKKVKTEDCSACHKEINKDWEPYSHTKNWKRYHGQVVRSGIDPPYENRCSLCHEDSKCASCHQAEEPENHNTYWVQRGHSITARMDRSNCQTCHQSDFCDRCHRETVPMNHIGGWGSPRDRHCYSCHIPVTDVGCGTCHETFPGHLEAPPLPNTVTHDTASETACRDCHISLGTLTHPDNGDYCRSCHK